MDLITVGYPIGLGLAAVAATLAAHGGEIRYERRLEGGSRFTALLPGKQPVAGGVSFG